MEREFVCPHRCARSQCGSVQAVEREFPVPDFTVGEFSVRRRSP